MLNLAFNNPHFTDTVRCENQLQECILFSATKKGQITKQKFYIYLDLNIDLSLYDPALSSQVVNSGLKSLTSLSIFQLDAKKKDREQKFIRLFYSMRFTKAAAREVSFEFEAVTKDYALI